MFFIQLLYLLTYIRLTITAVCSDATVGTANPPSSYTGTTDGTAYAYVMTDASVQFTCCGRIKTWKFYASSSGIIKLQVWRLSTGSTYTLVGENSFVVPTSAANQEIHYEVAEEDRIQFIENDFMGWYSPGSAMIPYAGTTGPDKTYYINTAVSTGNDYTFSTWFDNREYAIIVDITTNEEAYFDKIPAKIHVYDHLAVADVVLALQPVDTTHDDFTVSINSASTYFEIDSTNYQVKVKASLSTTTTRTETITPRITDSCSVNTLETLSIFIENKKPIITSLPSSKEVSETANSEILHTITAVDGETLSCSLDAVQPSTTVFQVKEKSTGSGVYGIYYVPVSSSGFDFDFDSIVRYDITVRCSDGRLSSDAGHFLVYIQKNTPPVFTNLPAEEIEPQQATARDVVVYQVSVTDPDPTTLTYSMRCDPVSGCPFNISSAGSVFTTTDLNTVQTPAYDVYVTVNDVHTTVGEKSLSFYISNINDIPTFANSELGYKIGIEENIAVGTTLFTYSTTELDSPDSVTYSRTSVPAVGATYVNIGSSNGEFTTLTDIDFETLNASDTTNFVFTVEATDGKDTSTTTVTFSIVNVNEAPSFSGSNYIINDVENVGETQMASASIAATDPDSNDVLKFTLDCNGYDTTYFEMDEDTGEVYFGRDFDTDVGHPQNTSCNVTVTDIGGLTDVEFLTINIADTNDFTPSFAQDIYTVFLFPSEAVGTELGTFTASDGDISTTWSTLIYALDQSGLGDSYFSIDENGTTTVAKDISSAFSYGQKVQIPMTATDGGGLVGSATLLLVFPEISTTSTTTTDLPFQVHTYANNGYWYSIAAVVFLMNLCMAFFLCYRYCNCLRSKYKRDNMAEEKKKADKLKALEEEKQKVRLKLLPLSDPWSINLHANYGKLDRSKLQEKSSSVDKSKNNDEKKSSEDTDSKSITTNITASQDFSLTQSSVSIPSFQSYRTQQHHIYNPEVKKISDEQKELW